MRSAVPSSLFRHSLARQAFKRPQQRSSVYRRFSSTESSQQNQQDALAAVQKAVGRALDGAQKLLGPIGEKAGNLLGAYKEPVLYNLAVTREVLKQVYLKEGLQPPSLASFREAYESIWTQVTNPGFVGGLIKSGEIGRVGVYGLQAYGIFKIGEIIGRRSLIGYKTH